jgi:hypothetical protein
LPSASISFDLLPCRSYPNLRVLPSASASEERFPMTAARRFWSSYANVVVKLSVVPSGF